MCPLRLLFQILRLVTQDAMKLAYICLLVAASLTAHASDVADRNLRGPSRQLEGTYG